MQNTNALKKQGKKNKSTKLGWKKTRSFRHDTVPSVRASQWYGNIGDVKAIFRLQ